MNLKIISFGSDDEYIRLAEKTVKSIKNLYSKATIQVFSDKNIPRKMNDYAKTYKRGYGYWIWKPLIIKESLEKLKEGEILLYVDGRSGLKKSGEPIKWLDYFMQESKLDISCWQMVHKEMHWTNGDIISAFKLNLNSELLKTGQFATTFHAYRKNKQTLNFVNEWLNFLKNNLAICRDEKSINLNHKEFIENRHDQSVFSLMVKTKIEQNDPIKFHILQNRNILNDNLLPHQKNHTKKYQQSLNLFLKKNYKVN